MGLRQRYGRCLEDDQTMKTSLSVIRFTALLTFSGMLHAQDWMNICSPGISIYHKFNLQQLAVRWDSVYSLTSFDSNFISFPNIREIEGEECIDTSAAGFLGKHVTKLITGWYWFENLNGDTIVFNALANVNDSWTLFNLGNGNYIEATVSQVKTDSVLGIPDQIKIIALNAKNKAGNIIPHIFNNMPIELSKTFGFTRIYDLRNFPEDTSTFLLAGKTEPTLGIQQLSWTEIITYDIGDEFHFHTHGEDVWSGGDGQIIKVVLDKIQYENDSVDYLIERCEHWISWSWNGVTTYNIQDTSWIRYHMYDVSPTSSFDQLPGSFFPYCTSSAHKYSWYYKQYGTRRAKLLVYDQYILETEPDTCWIKFYGWEHPLETKKFTDGLGCTYDHTVCGGQYWYWVTTNLVYYKKGDEIWGTPWATDCSALVPVYRAPELHQTGLRFSPNPATTHITISAPFTGELTIVNLNGQVLVQQTLNELTTTIDISTLPAGIYLVKLVGGKGVQVGKFTKQ